MHIARYKVGAAPTMHRSTLRNVAGLSLQLLLKNFIVWNVNSALANKMVIIFPMVTMVRMVVTATIPTQ